MKKRDFYKILFLIGFWELCTILITFYDASVGGFRSEIDGAYYSFWQTLLTSVLICLIGASLLGSLEVLLLGNVFRKKPLGLSIALQPEYYHEWNNGSSVTFVPFGRLDSADPQRSHIDHITPASAVIPTRIPK